MAEKNRLENKTAQRTMTIDGHKVTLSFARESNPALSSQVRNTLLDAFFRKNGVPACEAQA